MRQFFLWLIHLFNPSFIYYVKKNEVLPTPLEREEENQLLKQLKTGNLQARDMLIEHNLRLVVYVAKKYDGSAKASLEDLISIGTIGLVKAVNTFDIDKNIKLATYASRCIENEILMHLRKTNKLKLEVSLDEPLNVDYDGNELLLGDIIGTDEDVVSKVITENEQRQAMYAALKELSSREQEIMMLRYGLNGQDELTQKDVAELMGISQSYISRLEKKIIRKLRRKLNSQPV